MFKKISGQKPISLVREDALRAQASMKATLNQCLNETDVFIKKQMPQTVQQQKTAINNLGILAKKASKFIKK